MLECRAMLEIQDTITSEFYYSTLIIIAVIGACVGSFLNVVIYRVPRGMSVREPKRSFCPTCGAQIPWYLNLPLLSWLLLRGKSACCHKPIAVRYWLIELACTLLFLMSGWIFSYEGVLPLLMICLWGACMLALLAMDWEQMVVNPTVALIAAGCGVAAAVFDPLLVESRALNPWEGLLWSIGGALGGYLLFRLVALGGRLFFGSRTRRFSAEQAWSLRQDGEDILLTVGDQEYRWSEVFMENSHRLLLDEGSVEAIPGVHGRLTLEAERLVLPDGTCRELEDYESLSGTCRAVTLQREAMGSGDAWLALAIGSLCGWQGVIFALVGGSIIGLIIALLLRIGRGMPMPFGPSLILAAFLWLFWGPQILELYLSLIAPGM